jgi:glucose/arabinose dehydrogenase
VLPPGFSIVRFAGLYHPTAFAFNADGQLLVASLDGSVHLLGDDDADGRADRSQVFASGFPTPLGVAVRPESGDVFVSYQGAIARLRDWDGDGEADESVTLFSGLPFGRHQNDNLKFGPDGWLYMGVGSTCDACIEADFRSATIMRFDVETLESEVFASGMRNPFDLAFHPLTGDLFATDNGRDDLGLAAPKEELNHIIQGGSYGFPGCWDGHDQPGCGAAIAPAAFFESHSSANGLDFNTGGPFPAEYFANAFVSIFGSFLKPGVQTGVQRVALTPAGGTYLGEVEWFVRFPEGVMPLPLLFGPEGALYVGDHIGDAVYRISYGLPGAGD